MLSPMDKMTSNAGLAAARTVARTGEHQTWRAVETKLQQMGHHDAEHWFATISARGEIDALCRLYFKKRRTDA
jgi:hypothetical protein